MYSCHLFLVSSASIRCIQFLSFIVPFFLWNIPFVSSFLEEITSLSQSVVFLYFFVLITEEDFLISLLFFGTLNSKGYIFSFLLCLSLLFFHNYLYGLLRQPFCLFEFLFVFFWGEGVGEMVLITASCTVSQTSIHSSSATLSIRSKPLYLFVMSTVWLQGIWFRSYLHCWLVFPTFLNLSLNFNNKEFMIWATVSSKSWFFWLYRASSSLDAKSIINLNLVLTIWWCPCVEFSLMLLEESVYDQCILLAKHC